MINMKRSFLSAFSLSILTLSVLLITGCEPQLQFSTEDITVQAQNAVDVLPGDPVFVGMMNPSDLQENEHTNVFSPGSIFNHNAPDDAISRLKDFIEVTGFDPAEDLSEVYVAVEQLTNDGPSHASIVAYASIEPERLKSYVEEQLGDELQLRTYRGVDIFEAVDDDHAPSFSFVNDDMIIAATDGSTMESMIDRMEGEGNALSTDTEMMDLIARASSGKSGWFVAQKPADADLNSHGADNEMEATAAQIWAALDNVVMAVNVESQGLDSQVFLYPTANVSADDLSSLTKGMVAAMKAAPDLKEDQLEMLDKIDVRASNDHVRIGVYVDNETMKMIKG